MTPSDRLRLAIMAEDIGLQEFDPDQKDITRLYDTLEQILMKAESLPSTKAAAFWTDADTETACEKKPETAMKAQHTSPTDKGRRFENAYKRKGGCPNLARGEQCRFGANCWWDHSDEAVK